MTLKYESEVLFDLMKRDGDVAPSDVLPYESELKEKYLNQVVGAYPKLQDYRPEWLYYNLYGRIPSDFPDESVSNVTSASFYNVVPYAYKSAILKGNTCYRDIDTGEILETFEEDRNLELVSVKMPVLTTSNTEFLTTLPISFFEENNPVSNSGWANFNLPRTLNDVTIKCKINGLNQLRLNYNKSVTITNNDLKNGIEIKVDSLTDIAFHGDGIVYEGKGNLIMWLKDGTIELAINEKGSELVDGYKIPYKSNILTVNEEVELGSVGEVKDELDLLTRKITQRTETRAYQEGDESNSEVITDMTNTRYKLPKEVIKTVELSCINEQGESATFRPIEGTMFVNTSSQTLTPLLDMCVPVEATTQNLMSFINIEEEK